MLQSTRAARTCGALLLAAIAVVTAFVTLPAQAKGGQGKRPVKKEFPLVATPLGSDAGASGRIRVESQAQKKRLRERIQVNLKSTELSDGAQVSVYFTNPTTGSEELLLGTLTLRADDDDDDNGSVSGTLQVKNYSGNNNMPAGASPVADITSFVVKEADGDVLLTSGTPRDR